MFVWKDQKDKEVDHGPYKKEDGPSGKQFLNYNNQICLTIGSIVVQNSAITQLQIII